MQFFVLAGGEYRKMMSQKRKIMFAAFFIAAISMPVVVQPFVLPASAYTAGASGSPCTYETVMMIPCALLWGFWVLPGLVCTLIVIYTGYQTGCSG